MVLKFYISIVFGLVCLCDGRIHPGFSQESSCNTTNKEWMSKLADSRLLRHLSIPGTHDSAALYGGEQWQCQTMSLLEQLNAGIRSLDIRCRHVNNTFNIYHQFIDQQIDFDHVLSVVKGFLKDHPSEIILMRIKSEWLPENNSRSFEETFEDDYLDKNPNLFWKPEPNQSNDMTLKDVRGKIVILQDFQPKFNILNHIQMTKHPKYGLIWNENMEIQDDFTLLTTWSLYPKWLKVKEHLFFSSLSYNGHYLKRRSKTRFLNSLHSPSETQSSSKFFINFLSGSVGVKPFFVASGNTKWGTDGDAHFFGLINMVKAGSKYADFPKRRCLLGGRYCLLNFEGTNSLFYNYLQSNRMNFVGIVYADFPGCALIQSIIDVNFN